MTLVASALAGGDCIGGADALRTGGTARVLGFTAKAPSTPGAFLRRFRWGHVRQPDRVSRELPARAWAAGDGPGGAPFTIGLDSTICETYGLVKEGARRHGYTGQRGYHPLLAVAAGTGEVLMARLREGRANTACGAAHFLRETVSRVRYGGASGQLTGAGRQRLLYPRRGRRLPPDGCPLLHHHPPATIGQHASLRNLIEAIPGEDRTPVPYWMEGVADCGRDRLHPFPDRARRRTSAAHRPAGEANARFPTGPLRRRQLSRLHHRPGRRDLGTGGELEAGHRRHAGIENAIRDPKHGVGLNHHAPRAASPPTPPGSQYR